MRTLRTCITCGEEKSAHQFATRHQTCKGCDDAIKYLRRLKDQGQLESFNAKRPDYSHRSRARKAGAAEIATVDLRSIILRDASTCYLCKRKLYPRDVTFDHVEPLSRGGNHTAENIRVCCFACNVKKHARSLSDLDVADFERPDESDVLRESKNRDNNRLLRSMVKAVYDDIDTLAAHHSFRMEVRGVIIGVAKATEPQDVRRSLLNLAAMLKRGPNMDDD